jgi:hypothetical protein
MRIWRHVNIDGTTTLYRLRVNSQVPSKPTVINSIGGLVVLPISSGKWHGKSL